MTSKHEDTPQEPEWLSLKDAARVYSVSARTIRNQIETGRLPAYRVGGHTIRIKRSDLDVLAEPMAPANDAAGSHLRALSDDNANDAN